MTVRFYSSVALQTSLTAGITASATTIQVASTTGFPGSTPFVLALDYGAANEELVDVTVVAGLSLTVTRNVDGTSASTHNAGAVVRHVSSGRDFSDSRNHENASTNVHGLAVGSAVVGTTDTQTLTNKSLTRATGTLQNVNMFNVGGAFTTSVIGDSTNPSVNRFQILQNEITLQAMAVFDSTGGLFSFPLPGASDTSFRWRSFDPDGVTERSALRTAGALSLTPNSTMTTPNFWVRDDSNSTTKAAIAVTNLSGGAAYFQVGRDGHTLITPPGGAASGICLLVAPSNAAYTGNLQEWRNPAGATVASINQNGNFTTVGVGGIVFARKSADTARSSTVTATPDPHLSVAVQANATYMIEGYIIYNANTTGDFGMQFGTPAGATGNWNAIAWGRGATASIGTDGFTVRTNDNTINQNRTYGGDTTDITAHVRGLVITSGTAGNVTVDWAQAASDPGATTLRTNSHIMLTRVA